MLSPAWENLNEFLGLDTQDGFAKKATVSFAFQRAAITVDLTVTINETDYTATVDTAAGTWAVNVATLDLVEDKTVHVIGVCADTHAPVLSFTVDEIADEQISDALENDLETIEVTGTIEMTAATRSITGIFDEPYLDAQLGEYVADTSAPRFLCKQIDVFDITRGDRLNIEGAVYDIMSAPQADGTGMATLYLESPPDDQYRS